MASRSRSVSIGARGGGSDGAEDGFTGVSGSVRIEGAGADDDGGSSS